MPPTAPPSKPPASPFTHPVDRLTIATIDPVDDNAISFMQSLMSPKAKLIEVTAQYNPAKIEISKEVPWTETPLMGAHNKDGGRRDERRKVGRFSNEYTGDKARVMTLELIFDGYEDDKSIDPHIENLEKMASPLEPDAIDERKRHPPYCVVSWGNGMRRFHCVVSSLKIAYTMFSRSGAPLRATVNVTLTEVDVHAGNRG